ncbi:protein phosphatase 1 regulatory subunit 1C isoform X2 [Festucalex cinctus]
MDRGPGHSLFTTHTLSLSLSLSLSVSFFVCLHERRTAMEPGSPKKIQFDVPPLQGHLDPQAAEHIRRRRPTPATLQIYRQPEAADPNNASGGSQSVDGAQRKQSTLAPPTMKELHVQGAEQPDSQLSPITARLYAGPFPWTNQNGPEEANGNQAGLLANHGADVAQSNSSGGKLESPVPEEEEDIKH